MPLHSWSFLLHWFCWIGGNYVWAPTAYWSHDIWSSRVALHALVQLLWMNWRCVFNLMIRDSTRMINDSLIIYEVCFSRGQYSYLKEIIKRDKCVRSLKGAFVDKEGQRAWSTRPIPSEGKCCVCYIERMKLTKENILKIALGLLIGISIGYLIAEYLLPIVRQWKWMERRINQIEKKKSKGFSSDTAAMLSRLR